MSILSVLSRGIRAGPLVPAIIERLRAGLVFPTIPAEGTTYDTFLEISKGNIPGHAWFIVNGTSENIGTTQESVWPEDGVYVAPSSATIMTVSSDNSNDTALGTGLRTMQVDGLGDVYNKIGEIVTLDGQNPVSTVNSYLRIRKLTGRTAGSTSINEGIIYIGTGSISGGKPANVFNLIPIDVGISQTAFYTVPASKSAYIMKALWTVDAGKEVIAEIAAKPFGGSIIKRNSVFVSTKNDLSLEGATRLEGKTDMDIRAATTSQTAAVDVIFSLVEIDD